MWGDTFQHALGFRRSEGNFYFLSACLHGVLMTSSNFFVTCWEVHLPCCCQGCSYYATYYSLLTPKPTFFDFPMWTEDSSILGD